VKSEVFFAVVEVVFELAAGAELVVWSYRDVAGVEEPMNVRSEKEAVIDAVLSFLSHGLDMSGFEGRQCFLASNSTVTFVRVCDKNAKRPLTETLPDQR
jgi:hypothetical protein